MSKAIIINKIFSKVDVRCHSREIVCYQNGGSGGMSLAEYIGYAIDTTRRRGRCTDGKCALEDVQVLIRIGKVTGEGSMTA